MSKTPLLAGHNKRPVPHVGHNKRPVPRVGHNKRPVPQVGTSLSHEKPRLEPATPTKRKKRTHQRSNISSKTSTSSPQEISVQDIESLRREFATFCDQRSNIELWGRRAVTDAHKTVLRLRMQVGEILGLVQNRVQNRQDPLSALDALAKSVSWTCMQWIAYFIAVRQYFKEEIGRDLGKGSGKRQGYSGHLDTRLQTPLGTLYVRNSYDDKGTGTTRLYLRTADDDILDPSYSVIRDLLGAIGRQALIADLLRRFTLGQSMTSEQAQLVQQQKEVAIGKKDLFEDLTESESHQYFSFYKKPKKVTSHQYSGFEPKASKGKTTVDIRVGDFIAFLWGLFFIAEGRHAPIVAHYNLVLLELIGEGHLSFEACLTNFKYTKNKEEHLEAFTGSLFPSSNFAPYGYEFKTPHKKRYEDINELSRYQPSAFDTDDEITDVISNEMDEVAEGYEPLLGKIFESSKFVDVELFVLYKVAFIAYLREQVHPRSFRLFDNQGESPTPPQTSKQSSKILEEMKKLSISTSISNSSSTVSRGQFSQFQIPGAGTACSPISVMAIAALLAHEQTLSTTQINDVVIRGGMVYQGIVGNPENLISYLAGVGKKKAEGTPIEGVYLNPYEIPQDVLNGASLTWGGQHTAWRFTLADTLKDIFDSGEPQGVAIVMGAYTVSVTFVNGHYYVFDSHGFGDITNAFVEKHDTLDSVVDRLHAMVKERMPNFGRLSVSIFRPASG